MRRTTRLGEAASPYLIRNPLILKFPKAVFFILAGANPFLYPPALN